ncbi:MAG: adenylosuccinate lyase [Thermodesulfobacteriota bacterium]
MDIDKGLTALSVLDGRYARLTAGLNEVFSECGLMKHRVFVEIQWLVFLSRELGLMVLDEEQTSEVKAIADHFTPRDAARIKEIEKGTNHDVKAVEYFIKERLSSSGMASVKEWVHFACTSEDINNTAYALMLKKGRALIREQIGRLLEILETYGEAYKAIPMMARTHGQPASPTTIGKEFINFAWRIREELDQLMQIPIQAKMNGATGNFNAHDFVFPNVDWIGASERFLSTYLDLQPLLYTTQINPYHYVSRTFHAMIRIASVTVDLDRDMWGYVSLGYFKQKLKAGEIGSSTMPHKVNPIDFENSEGNMGIAISMMEHLAVKLLNSRFQRDLTDSTVLRNMGAIFGYFQIGLLNAIKGLEKLDIDHSTLQQDLDENVELLAEPIQTAMRVFGEENPYERLKELTRGKKISREELREFTDRMDRFPEDIKTKIQRIRVEQYTGLATRLVDRYLSDHQGQ